MISSKRSKKGLDLVTIMVVIFFILILLLIVSYIGIHTINKGISLNISLPG